VGEPGSGHEGQWGTRALVMMVSGGPGLMRVSGGTGLWSWGSVGEPGSGHEGQWRNRALFMSPTADGKKLSVWREVLVLMDLSLLPEGRHSNSL